MLDIRTLFIALFAVLITVGGIMLLSRRWQPDTRSVDIWGAAALCLGVGSVLSAFRDTGPGWLCVLVAVAGVKAGDGGVEARTGNSDLVASQAHMHLWHCVSHAP